MIIMRPDKYIFCVLAAATLCACLPPVRKAAAPAAPVRKEASAVKLSPEDENKVEGLYYKAVGAYSNNDMSAALRFLDEISVISPSYPPAAELRGKIKSVAGSR